MQTARTHQRPSQALQLVSLSATPVPALLVLKDEHVAAACHLFRAGAQIHATSGVLAHAVALEGDTNSASRSAKIAASRAPKANDKDDAQGHKPQCGPGVATTRRLAQVCWLRIDNGLLRRRRALWRGALEGRRHGWQWGRWGRWGRRWQGRGGGRSPYPWAKPL